MVISNTPLKILKPDYFLKYWWDFRFLYFFHNQSKATNIFSVEQMSYNVNAKWSFHVHFRCINGHKAL